MNRAAWKAPVSSSEAARRAGGRKHYNEHRKLVAAHRRLLLVEIMRELQGQWGWRTAAAKRLALTGVRFAATTRQSCEFGDHGNRVWISKIPYSTNMTPIWKSPIRSQRASKINGKIQLQVQPLLSILAAHLNQFRNSIPRMESNAMTMNHLILFRAIETE